MSTLSPNVWMVLRCIVIVIMWIEIQTLKGGWEKGGTLMTVKDLFLGFYFYLISLCKFSNLKGSLNHFCPLNVYNLNPIHYYLNYYPNSKGFLNLFFKKIWAKLYLSTVHIKKLWLGGMTGIQRRSSLGWSEVGESRKILASLCAVVLTKHFLLPRASGPKYFSA